MAGLALLILAFGQFWLVPYTELLYKAPLSGHEPIIGAPEQALIENRFLDFRRYLHQQMRPLAWLITISTLIVLLGFPLFFRVNLVNPLQALVQGTRQVMNSTCRWKIECGNGPKNCAPPKRLPKSPIKPKVSSSPI